MDNFHHFLTALLSTALLILVFVFKSAPAYADTAIDGGYIAVAGSAIIVRDINLGSRLSAKFKTGFGGLIEAGYKTEEWRYAFQLSAFDASARQSGPTAPLNGKVNVSGIPLLVNVYYDLDDVFIVPLVPYFGMGLGYVILNTKVSSFGVPAISRNNNVFGYQLIGGLGYNMTSEITAFLDVRYLITIGVRNLNNKLLLPAHINLGILYRFG